MPVAGLWHTACAVPFDKLADKIIREAMREGRFDHLPGAGQPIDLEDYFTTPEDRRMAYGLLKSANLVPEEVELMAEVARLDEQAAAETSLEARKALQVKAQNLRLRLAVARERR